MLWLKRILGFVLVVILIVATLIFVLENQQVLEISLLGFMTPTLPVAVFVVSAFVGGGFLGVAIGMLVASRAKFQLKTAQARLAKHESELSRLKSAASAAKV
jgi:putative membrane protein